MTPTPEQLAESRRIHGEADRLMVQHLEPWTPDANGEFRADYKLCDPDDGDEERFATLREAEAWLRFHAMGRMFLRGWINGRGVSVVSGKLRYDPE
ncbi:MAG: hypothetical protein U0835_00470 [Isosphaeraceae bacterium]